MYKHTYIYIDAQHTYTATHYWYETWPIAPMYGFNAPEDKGSVALGSMGSVSALSQVEDAASEAARVWLPSGHSWGKSTKKWVKTY